MNLLKLSVYYILSKIILTYIYIIHKMEENKDDVIIDLKKQIKEMADKLKKLNEKKVVGFQNKLVKKTGIKKLTTEEAEDLMNRQDYTNIYGGKENILDPTKAVIKLQDHQKRFLEGFLLGNLRSAVVFHGVGTGKTFSAVAVMKVYLQIYPKNKVMIITPPALLFNMIDSMISYGLNPQDKRISYFSYVSFANNKNLDTTDTMLVVDEAHNLRTNIITHLNDKEEIVASKGTRPFEFIEKSKKAHKVVLLTATPFINTPYDIENLLAIGDGRMPYDSLIFGEMVSDRDVMYDYFKFRISKYDRTFGSGDFPKQINKYIPLVVDTKSKDGKSIRAEANRTNPAYVFSRLNSLRLNDLKVNYMSKIIKDNPTKKYVIYTAFHEGVGRIIISLTHENTEIGVIGIVSGTVNTIEKATNIDMYNNYDNKESPDYKKCRIIIITKAGSEGVSLIETRGIFIMDGVWNEAMSEQIIARAIRYKSHERLPKKERFVEVYKLFICYDSEVEYLKKIEEGKFNYGQFLNNFQKFKSTLKNNKSNKNFNLDTFIDLKKGSDERKKYIQDNMNFARGKAKFQTQDVLSNITGFPSTDFFMFVLQKSKENVINMFIDVLVKIPMIENVISDLPEIRTMFKEFYLTKEQTGYKGGEDTPVSNTLMINVLQNIYKDGLKNASTVIERQLNSKKSNLKVYLDKRADVLDLIKQKTKLRVKQEYFTPDQFVKEIIDMSGIQSEKSGTTLNILEPTAGWGNIVLGILDISSKNNLISHIDMVEIQPSNRVELKKVVKILPTYITLAHEPDFIKFLSSKKYDYIFMNPPFHLEKKNNPQFKKDVYSYDFIKRAYAMLNDNGVLVAITGREWESNNDIVKLFKTLNAKILNRTVEWTNKPNSKGKLKKGMDIKALDVSFFVFKKKADYAKLDNQFIDDTNRLLVDYNVGNNIEEDIKENIDETVNDLVVRRNKELVEEKTARKKRRKEYDDIRKKQKPI